MTITDRATWPELLTLSEVAAIYRRGLWGLRKDLQARTFVPAPFLTRPYRWRKADVLRHLDGSSSRLRKVG